MIGGFVGGAVAGVSCDLGATAISSALLQEIAPHTELTDEESQTFRENFEWSQTPEFQTRYVEVERLINENCANNRYANKNCQAEFSHLLASHFREHSQF